MTERLWLTEPRRKTALATVLAVQGAAFALDRSLYCPLSHAYRHPQVQDQGTIWTPDGEKRRLVRVVDEDGRLWHRLRGATPAVGDVLQCHLDVERRAVTARAHTAMHLLLHVAPRGLPALAADPEVRGGGHVRFTFAAPWLDPKVLAGWRQQALAAAAEDRAIVRHHVVDTEVAHRLRAQAFADGVAFPGPETTREAVEVVGLGMLPCDGTHLERSGGVRDLALREAHPDRDGRYVVVLQAR